MSADVTIRIGIIIRIRVIPVIRGHELRFRHKWSDFRLALRVRQRAELGRYTAGNGSRLAAGLETCEVWTVAPRKGPAQFYACLDRGVMNDVDRPLIVG